MLSRRRCVLIISGISVIWFCSSILFLHQLDLRDDGSPPALPVLKTEQSDLDSKRSSIIPIKINSILSSIQPPVKLVNPEQQQVAHVFNDASFRAAFDKFESFILNPSEDRIPEMNALLESIEVDIKCQEWNDRVASRTFVPWTSTYGSRSADILNRSEVSLRLFDRCAVPELCKAFRTGSIDNYNWEGRGSQYGQDLWVAQHFNFKLNGVFIDIGANEGAMGSNSLLLEKCLGWRGICVEPGLREFAMLSKPGLRSCAAFNAAAAATDGYADFYAAGTLGGLADEVDQAHKSRLNREFGQMPPKIRVRTRQVAGMLKDSGLDGSAVDFLSVDVEGVELMVIKSIDLAGIHYPVIIAENNGGGDAMERYLNTVGYTKVTSLGIDLVFVHSK